MNTNSESRIDGIGVTAEEQRIFDCKQGAAWKLWGPYLSERQWGTVREDYSPNGAAWEYLTFEQSYSKAYRWGEDGIGGICDDRQLLCFSLALWNGKDPVLKERYFGLTGPEGNHGEDVKEYYYYLDSTPTHSYMKMLYKYPQAEFPYNALRGESRRRSRSEPEYELIDTGAFEGDKYFDVFVEYAKNEPTDILILITIANRAEEAAEIDVIPLVLFRNTWSWNGTGEKPSLDAATPGIVRCSHKELGAYALYYENGAEALVCENETNVHQMYGQPAKGFSKDGINDYIITGDANAVNPQKNGTKAGLRHRLTVNGGESKQIRLRLTTKKLTKPFDRFDSLMQARRRDADAFYDDLTCIYPSEDANNVQRQAFAGLFWGKQFYYYDVDSWLDGDPPFPPPPQQRARIRNDGWRHLNNADIISMPDKWEFPWFAAWDLAFHCIPFALVDPEFAKEQLLLLTKERYLHPNGQLPAYEWNFSDVNPPVHAWAAWRVYKIEKKKYGVGDVAFLEKIFHKMVLYFTWWVNRKDQSGRNVFQGGFLGLDNIGVFDRSADLPAGGRLEQSDATAWMAMFSLNMMQIAIELSQHNPVYQDLAIKFFEHFLSIAKAMMNLGGEGISLWDEEDAFYYDVLHTVENGNIPIRVRSMVGLIPLFAVEPIDPEMLKHAPEVAKHMDWVMNNKPGLASLVSRWQEPGKGERRLFSLLRGSRMKSLLRRMLDEKEFLSPYGVRSLSKYHEEQPYPFFAGGRSFSVKYVPGESDNGLFGGNSNWRGPIWFPMNFLIIESLHKFHHYYGDDFKVECPTGSGVMMTLREVGDELGRRLDRIFLRDEQGRRAVYGTNEKFQSDPHFREYVLFHEYFHGDTAEGLGASHQTGWTALVAKLLTIREKSLVVND